MINACAIADKGLEKVALMELDEIIGVKGKAGECVVAFNCKSYDDLFKFCYFSQSTERIMILIESFDFKKSDDLLKKAEASLKNIKLGEWLEKNKSFKVECKRLGEHSFGSHTIEKGLGQKIINAVKKEKELGFTLKADLESPDTIFYVFIKNNKAHLGIDLMGRDPSKRQYRVFTSPGVVNSNLAYSIIRLAEYSSKKKLIDVVCKSGNLCIEAALYGAKLSPNYYSKEFSFKKLKPFQKKNWETFFKKMDSSRKSAKLDITGYDSMLRNVEASKKNSKLAGVDKIINFSKMDVEWLDTKLDKGSVDIIASRIPCPSKHTAKSTIKKFYKELFYQAEFVMKKSGKMALLSEHLGLLKEMITPAFIISKEDELWAGKQRYDFVIIKKK